MRIDAGSEAAMADTSGEVRGVRAGRVRPRAGCWPRNNDSAEVGEANGSRGGEIFLENQG